MVEGNSITRRDSLKAVSGGAIFNVAPIIGKVQTPTTTLVIHKKGDKIIKTQDVPTDWWQQMKKARKVHKDLQNRYSSVASVKDVRLEVRDKTRAGYKLGVVKVYVDSSLKVIPTIPDSINGIEIRMGEYTDSDPSCYEGEYDPVKGGVAICSDYGCGSATCRVQKADYSKEYLLSAAHVFNYCGLGTNGDDASQGPNDIGQLAEADPVLDMALIEPDINTTISHGYTDEIVDASSAEGRVTKDGVTTLMGAETEVYSVGSATCRTSGKITGMGASDSSCQGTGTDYIDTTFDIPDGDSGCAVFDESYSSDLNQYYSSIIGTGTKPIGLVSSAYKMHIKHDIIFT